MGLPVAMAVFGDLGGFFVADQRVQRRDQGDRFVDARIQQHRVGLDALRRNCTCSVRQAAARWRRLLCRAQAMSGSNALSCNCPASTAMVMAASLPMASKQAMLHHFRNHRIDLARA